MTSASFSKTPHKTFLAVITTVVLLPSAALAQYAPPPMFEERSTNTTRPQTGDGYIVEPMQSPNVQPQVAPRAEAPPIIRPRVSVDPDKNPQPAPTPYIPRMAPTAEPQKAAPRKIARTPAPPVVPARKPVSATPVPAPVAAPTPDTGMTEPVFTPQPVYSPVVKEEPKPAASPAPAPAPRAPNAPMPAAKVTSPGVVTGPKTMPAVPTTSVDQVETFDDSALQNEPTILERHLEATQKKAEKAKPVEKKKEEATLTPVPAGPKKVEDPSASEIAEGSAPSIDFDDAKPAVMKKILPYQAGQVDLSKEDLSAIASGVQTELKSRPDWRIQIRSFATPQGDGLSSDRRIALSRALSVRTALVGAGIDPSVIDLRADGLQTDSSQTGDRVDLYLYNPAEPVQAP